MSMSEFLKPLENSGSADVIEEQTKALFIAVMTEIFADKINDIYSYGTPQYASHLVLERFIKQIGLVVLRRPDTSHLIMRILYENWTSLASKRGLAFLEFALEMLWTGKWEVIRLWHPSERLNQYPRLVTEFERPNSILTSRIYVLMSADIDVQELETLAPSLQRLIPANILPEIGVRMRFNEEDDLRLGTACVMQGTQITYAVPESW